jgi:hypothetical protein
MNIRILRHRNFTSCYKGFLSVLQYIGLFLTSTSTSKQVMNTRTLKSVICQCIVCINLEVKTECRNTDRHVFRGKCKGKTFYLSRFLCLWV